MDLFSRLRTAEGLSVKLTARQPILPLTELLPTNVKLHKIGVCLSHWSCENWKTVIINSFLTALHWEQDKPAYSLTREMYISDKSFEKQILHFEVSSTQAVEC